MIALQPGRSLLHFLDLDDDLRIQVTIGADVGEGLEILANAPERDARGAETVYAAHEVELTQNQREVLAVAFRHLIERDVAQPANIAKHAAQSLGKSEQAVKNVLTDVRRKVNRERWLDLRDTEHLGFYLCRVTRAITSADLPNHG